MIAKNLVKIYVTENKTVSLFSVGWPRKKGDPKKWG
jgi:hypothetical protein